MIVIKLRWNVYILELVGLVGLIGAIWATYEEVLENHRNTILINIFIYLILFICFANPSESILVEKNNLLYVLHENFVL